jgi:hypothetical protein
MFTLQQLLDAGLPAVSTDGNDAGAETQFERELTQAEWLTYLSIADPETHQRKSTYVSTVQTLTDIENAVSPTNAQVIAAMKFMAKTLRLLLKLLIRQYI